MKFRSYLVEQKEQLKRWKQYQQKNKMLAAGVDVLKKIESKGYKAYIVGGSVRDIILGQPAHDIDISTSMPIDELAKIWKVTDIGKSRDFGIVVIKHKGFSFEIAQFRSDSYERPKIVRKILK